MRLDDREHFADEAVVGGRIGQAGARAAHVWSLIEVVADRIGKDRDDGRGEVRLKDEDVILEPPSALWKPDLIRGDEGVAEQLVGRERLHEGSIPQGDAVTCLGEELRRHPASMSDGPADDDVGSVQDRKTVQVFQRARAELVVLVKEEDVLAARGGDADVSRLAGPARVFLVDDADVRVSGGERIEP